MEPSQLIAHCGSRKLTREELTAVPTPEGTSTHRPVPHHEIVGGLVETLSFRHIGVVRDEYAVSEDGMKMFGVLDLETSFNGCLPFCHRRPQLERQVDAPGLNRRLPRLRL